MKSRSGVIVTGRRISESEVYLRFRRALFRGSARYWEKWYASGGNSGVGSYGPTAQFKADVINEFVREKAVSSVIEFGCGDGHQLSLAMYPRYVGLDVSATAVRMCEQRFYADPTKSFFWYDPTAFKNNGALSADLALSLDVILHLVEDRVYETYMSQLFEAATRFVGVFSVNQDQIHGLAPHNRFRNFTNWVSRERPDWTICDYVENPSKGEQSLADFYFFERT